MNKELLFFVYLYKFNNNSKTSLLKKFNSSSITKNFFKKFKNLNKNWVFYLNLNEKYLRYFLVFMVKLSVVFNFYLNYFSLKLYSIDFVGNSLYSIYYLLFFFKYLRFLFNYSKFNFFVIFLYFFYKKFVYLYRKKYLNLNRHSIFYKRKNSNFYNNLIFIFKRSYFSWLFFFFYNLYLDIVYIYFNKFFFLLFFNKFNLDFSLKFKNLGNFFNNNFLNNNNFKNISIKAFFIKNRSLIVSNFYLVRLFQYFLNFDIKKRFKRTVPSLVRYIIKRFFFKSRLYKKFVFRFIFKGRMNRQPRASYFKIFSKKSSKEHKYAFSLVKSKKIDYLAFPMIMQFGITNVSMLIFFKKKIIKKKWKFEF